MPTLFTHAVVPLLTGSAAGKQRISRPLLLTGAIAAILPDADVLSFRFNIAYADAFGHRGAVHSLAFGLLVASLAALLHRRLHTTATCAFVFTSLAAMSHPLLDMLTDGGLGVALVWPLNNQRYFFPWRPIQVSPIGARFFSIKSWPVVESELLWVWLPAGLLALVYRGWRRSHDKPSG